MLAKHGFQTCNSSKGGHWKVNTGETGETVISQTAKYGPLPGTCFFAEHLQDQNTAVPSTPRICGSRINCKSGFIHAILPACA